MANFWDCINGEEKAGLYSFEEAQEKKRTEKITQHF